MFESLKKFLRGLFGSEVADLQAEVTREMPGTTGSGEYFVLLATALGRVGIRPFGSSYHRIRVEPSDEGTACVIGETLTSFAGWKQLSEQFRFSIVVGSEEETAEMVLRAVDALRSSGGEEAVNSAAPERFRTLIDYESGELAENRIAAFVAAVAPTAVTPTETVGSLEEDLDDDLDDEDEGDELKGEADPLLN